MENRVSACSGCKMVSRCRESTSASTAGRGFGLAFGLPLLVMLIVMAFASMAGFDEGMTAILMLASLVLYYFMLWLFRNRIATYIMNIKHSL